MKINIIEVPKSGKSFTMFAEPDKELLRQTKTIRCGIHKISKTRISTDIHFGKFAAKINFPVDGIKTFEQSEYNYFSGNKVTSHYFIKSKKQNMDVFKEYLKAAITKALAHMYINLDEVTLELETENFY